jgi:hypothetical protein
MQIRRIWVTALSALLSTAGCGDDGPSEAVKDAGSDAGTPPISNGHGDAGGDAGQSEPVVCGSTSCAPVANAQVGTVLKPCCADEAASECGLSLAGGPCMAMPVPDPRCESVTQQGLTLPGCCTDTGRCGLDASQFGMAGCTSLDLIAGMAGGMAMAPGFPTPRDCDAQDGGEADAGR